MITEEPKISQTGRYSVTQASKALNVHRNTIINNANAGNISFGVKKTNGRKFFKGSELIKFWRSQI